MTTEIEEKVKRIEKQISKWITFDTIASIALGLGIGAKFTKSDTFIHPIFNNDTLVNVLIGFGIAGMAFCILKIIPLFKEKKELSKLDN